MSDPRAANCRAFAVNPDGKVVGVELKYLENPTSKYELVSAILLDEIQATGNTIAKVTVADVNGNPAYPFLWMAWPWMNFEQDRPFDHIIPPGNNNGEFMVSDKYTPPVIAWPCIFLGDSSGMAVKSDVIGGIGLPGARHVSYALHFRERGIVEPPDPEPPPGDLAGRLELLGRHLGAWE